MAKPRQSINAELVIVPDRGVPSEVILIARDPKKSGMAIYCSSDGGKTLRSMIPAPTADTRKGSVLTVINEVGDAAWELPSKPAPTPALSGHRQYIPFSLVGDLRVGVTFGYIKIPSRRNASLLELQISVQDAANQAITVDLVNGSGAVQGRAATLTSGSRTSTTILDAPLRLGAGSVWRMKVTGCGTDSSPGQNITVLAGIEYLS